jgi:hypothetical protein
MSNKENPNYYAIIPASVRYDKSLTPNAKLLYGEITALCNEKGFCWASNDYFATLYGVSKGSISSWIAQLAKAKYISLQMIYREGSKEILNRYIRLFDDPIPENLNTPIPEKLKDNITSLNNTNNNIPTPAEKREDERFLIFYQNYPRKVGKKKARMAFNKVMKEGETLDSILSKLKTYEKQIARDKTEEKYIKHPATFLNCLEDFEEEKPQENTEKKILHCAKCGVQLNNYICPSCFTNHDTEGNAI